jgi:hypothetical protein
MCALPAPQPSGWAPPEPLTRPSTSRRPRPSTRQGRSPHTRFVQAALELFPGSEVVEHHPAPRPER